MRERWQKAGRGSSLGPFLPGLFLIALGILVLLAPRLIAVFIAALLFAAGAAALYIGFKIKQTQKDFSYYFEDFFSRR